LQNSGFSFQLQVGASVVRFFVCSSRGLWHSADLKGYVQSGLFSQVKLSQLRSGFLLFTAEVEIRFSFSLLVLHLGVDADFLPP
jgi:hypothetical protein